MKRALVEGRLREAEPDLSGECPVCGSILVARCGEIRVWHWAHRGERHCDPWWDPETKWHRDWKNEFPSEWQERVHRADDGERHIADIKTAHGRILEFQHSYLEARERRSREAFYGPKMVWVVNGLRRKRDKPNFYKALSASQIIRLRPFTVFVPSKQCALLRDWANSRVAVFFDFGEPVLWRLDPNSPNGEARLSPVRVVNLIEAFLKKLPLKGIHAVKNPAGPIYRPPPIYPLRRRRSRRPRSFAQYMARKHRAQSQRRM